MFVIKLVYNCSVQVFILLGLTVCNLRDIYCFSLLPKSNPNMRLTSVILDP